MRIEEVFERRLPRKISTAKFRIKVGSVHEFDGDDDDMRKKKQPSWVCDCARNITIDLCIL